VTKEGVEIAHKNLILSSYQGGNSIAVLIGPFRIRRSNMVQMWIGIYLALMLLVVGLWLNPANFFVQVGIFIGAVIVGGGLPF
jgi:hypothetical protein